MTERPALARLQALGTEQAAARRVATLVAGSPDPSEVFACVCAEVGTVLDVKSTNLVRFQGTRTAKVVGGWSVEGEAESPVRRRGSTRRRDGGGEDHP